MSIKLDLDVLGSIGDAAFRTLEKTADALLTEVKTADVMPRRTGEMEDNQTFIESDRSENRVAIVTNTPYAHRLYTHPEYNFYRGDSEGNGNCNPNAQGEWLELWISGEKKERPAEIFAEMIKKNWEINNRTECYYIWQTTKYKMPLL